MTKMPVLFISHGSPLSAIENDSYTVALEKFGKNIRKPKAVVAVSAHWEAGQPVRVTTSERPAIIYDFGGFPDELYRIEYAAIGEPAVSRKIIALLNMGGIESKSDPKRGLDHGVWVPLRRLFPDASVPIVEVTLPVPRDPAQLLKIGAALASLREEDVLLFGTGGVVHNLRLLHFGDKDARVDEWAAQFDRWFASRIETRDVQALVDYRRAAPKPFLSVPTTEHFDPVFFALGAAPEEKATLIHEGFQYGNLSTRSFTLG